MQTKPFTSLRLTLLVVILLAATQAMSQTVRVRWERNTDFEKYQTYTWLDGTRVKDETSHRFIVEYVDGQLGINSVFKDENEPDLYAVYHASAEGTFEITGGYGSDWKGAEAVTANSKLHLVLGAHDHVHARDTPQGLQPDLRVAAGDDHESLRRASEHLANDVSAPGLAVLGHRASIHHRQIGGLAPLHRRVAFCLEGTGQNRCLGLIQTAA